MKHGTGRNNAVGIAIRYDLDDPGIEPGGGGRNSPHLSIPSQGPTLLPTKWGTGSFPELKRPGRSLDQPHPSSAEVKERVQLYLYSTSVPSCHVIGWTFIETTYWIRTEYFYVPRRFSETIIHWYTWKHTFSLHLVKHHSMKGHERVEVLLHAFLTSAPGGHCQLHSPGAVLPPPPPREKKSNSHFFGNRQIYSLFRQSIFVSCVVQHIA
jgi:hypothetical protein